ncbi:hypothetical protein JHK87_044696 [Glycine soja]|nr:hypothetical protein JHK87_044696 [Glycine soja]
MVSESEAVMSATPTQTHTHNTFAYSYSCGEDAANANGPIAMEHPQQNPYNYSNTQFVEELYSNQQFTYHTPTPDLLDLLHLPNPIPGDNRTNVSSVSYDPYLHLNLQQQQQPTLRELLPHMPALRNDFPFGGAAGGDDIQDFGNGLVDFTQQEVGKRRGGKRTKQFTSTTTERQRRVDLSSKFDALKELIPNPSKSDRASVVGDAINYIRELKRTVEELKLLVEKKRLEKQRVMMRHKVETEGESSNLDPAEYSESLRSSWIQRKTKDTEVDVRIVDNEVTIKLVQRKKIDCLVHVSHLLDQLNLDLQHVAGGHIGDFCSYLFNTKICEGSSIYASAIANKLIQVMDTSLAAASLA